MSSQYRSHPEQDQKYYIESGHWQTDSLGQLLKNWAKEFSDKPAIVDGNTRLSFQDLDNKADSLAAGLHNIGIKSGDRVLVQLPNGPQFVVLCFALFRLGALPILTLPAHRERDLSALCKLAEPVAYVTTDKFLGFDHLALAKKIQSQHSFLKNILTDKSIDAEGVIPLRDLERDVINLPEPKFSDIALLLLSGGTTGTPKLIPRTHADYAFNARASAELCGLNKESVYLAALPIGHNFPLACPGLLGTLEVGGTVVMAKTPGSDETFDLIQQEKVTFTSLVPPLVQLWLSAREWDKTDISSLQFLQVGGSRFEKEIATQVTPVLGCKLQQVFGMAEGLICYTRLDDSDDVVINSQGRPLCADDQIRIVNSDGTEVTPGEIGELQTKGPYTLRGYYRAEEHNGKTFTKDGFYQSGDLVRMTPEGNIVVEGRIKEQINRAGEKIAVAEVEQPLGQHPDIESCVVVAIPDKRLGERSGAFIISKNPNINLRHIHRYLTEQGLARHKLPDQLQHVPQWPLTAVGKIDKKRLVTLLPSEVSDTTMSELTYYTEDCLSIDSKPLNLALKVSQSGLSDDYAIYEHKGEWSIGIGQYATISLNKNQAHVHCNGKDNYYKHERLCLTLEEATKNLPIKDWRAYGSAKFELSHMIYDLKLGEKIEDDDSLVELFIPQYEIRITNGQALLRTINSDDLNKLATLVHEADRQCSSEPEYPEYQAIPTDIKHHQYEQYKTSVKNAVDEIHSKKYQKVILSRQIPLPAGVNLAESYRFGRLNNAPARSFLLNYGNAKLAGFSPETVAEVSADGWVSTQPLAGTRSLGKTWEEEVQLKKELLADTKEIAEHAASVKLAQEELLAVCDPDTVTVNEFMDIRRRGSVQHLASRVKGRLAENKNAWDAFEALFPAVTASGIPKKEAIEAISHLENQQRGWYSGCVMIVDSNGAMDAALVLRSIYQQGDICWLQAGAGIVDQSKPERELEETIEKLSCISQYITTHSNNTSSTSAQSEAVECQ